MRRHLQLECDVVRVYVDYENAVRFENAQYGLRFGPIIAELLRFLGSPIGHHFVGEFGSVIEIGSTKIENKGTLHDGHFDDPKLIVARDELRYFTFANLR